MELSASSVLGLFFLEAALELFLLFLLSLQIQLELVKLSHLVVYYLMMIAAACVRAALHACLTAVASTSSASLASDRVAKASRSHRLGVDLRSVVEVVNTA